jgi:hypothetical protein
VARWQHLIEPAKDKGFPGCLLVDGLTVRSSGEVRD